MTIDQYNEGTLSVCLFVEMARYLRRDEGEKDCPACVALTFRNDAQDLTHLVMLAISGTPPTADQTAIEIPGRTTDAKRGWVTVSECNYDILEQSWDFPINSPPQGRFSRPFLKKVRAAAL
jgi:hypothetical protein